MRSNLLTIAVAIVMLTCVHTPAFSQSVPIGVRGSVPQCTHAQLHAGTCQQAVAGYLATITNGLSGAPNRCAAGAGTGSDQITCRFKGGIWTEFEPIAATGLTNPLVGQLNADGYNINNIGTILVPDLLTMDLDTDGDAVAGDMFRIRDGLGNVMYEFPQGGKAHIGNSAVGGTFDLPGTLDETALLVSGNIEVDGGIAALGTLSSPSGAQYPGEVLFFTTFGTPDGTIRFRPNTTANTTSWDWQIPINNGEPNQLLLTDGNGVTSWADIGIGSMADDAIGIAELDLIDGDTPANGDCLTYDTGGANGTIEAVPCASASTGSFTFSGIQMQSNTSAQIRLDADGGGTENFEVRDGDNIPRFSVSENGTVQIQGTGGGTFLLPNPSGTVVYTLPSDDGDSGEQLQTNGSGTLSWEPAGSGASLPVVDTTSIAEGSADNTKEVRLEVDGLTTGTVRVITMPDANVNLGALTSANLGTDSVGAAQLDELSVESALEGVLDLADMETLGTGALEALGINVGSAGAVVTNGGALGTPSSGNGSNITGLSASNMSTGSLDLGSGTIRGGVSVEVSAGSGTESAAEGQWVTSVATATRTLPATSATGQSICYFVATAHTLSIDPDPTDEILLAGAAIGTGDKIQNSSAAAGDYICLLNATSSGWYTLGARGTWIDAGP